jgi:hypothetical protein
MAEPAFALELLLFDAAWPLTPVFAVAALLRPPFAVMEVPSPGFVPPLFSAFDAAPVGAGEGADAVLFVVDAAVLVVVAAVLVVVSALGVWLTLMAVELLGEAPVLGVVLVVAGACEGEVDEDCAG